MAGIAKILKYMHCVRLGVDYSDLSEDLEKKQTSQLTATILGITARLAPVIQAKLLIGYISGEMEQGLVQLLFYSTNKHSVTAVFATF